MKIDEWLLKEKGYRFYSKSMGSDHKPEFKGLYQKYISDEKGKKYFINFRSWDLRRIIKTREGLSFDCDVQFYTQEGNVFNVSYCISEETNIEEVEEFYETMFSKMECGYYEEQ